ncbi:MAG: hypothetical protein H7Z38_06620 [Rubrivivax sp.]|nr:hypothetical protein [Pyrinomonadaceae bacterium]
MKGRIFVVVILVVAAAFAGRWVTRTRNSGMSNEEQTRHSFRLDAGARVEVRGINGSVEISTAETDTADVRVVCTAGSREDLENGKVFVEQTSSASSSAAKIMAGAASCAGCGAAAGTCGSRS